MATFVLVHGAMHGAWCWRAVRQRLTGAGHEVFTPTLTGQGERRRSLTPDVGVATHVDDLTDLLWFEDLRDVHLVLHSYAGILAGPVAERCAERLAGVVFLAAFLADPGQSLLDVEPPSVAARYREIADATGDGWRVPAGPAFLDQWGVTDPDLRRWAGPRLTDFPLRCQTDAVHFVPDALDGLRKAYVRHTAPALDSLAPFHRRAVTDGWETHDLPCGHDTMLAAPRRTADVLGRIAAGFR
ncbi:alpha/beta fold hydrolase [Streptomyces sp. PTM05]|uniref:Alpha/beta fold hydrolase n=1 Tax=Streptantibioticus parmotrematis TaxID=2873249 RepID=A0ABS7QU13_9ACTN|nr:alpha/beta fold hydrolase [Streptantibioticus parmotrematis]MBY8885870.1 alpha/beta fold hydrolase [Streptantibioticus parmotrematis]